MRFLIAIPVFLFLLGTYKGFRLGAPDFHVFHFAAELVVQGRFSELYTVSPDRFLYAPGFAWLLLPLALFSMPVAFVFWSGLKAFLFGVMLKILYRRAGLLATTLGVLFFSRSLLIDLRYGQVNLIILSLAVIALDRLCEPRSRREELTTWYLFSLSAVSKLFPVTLILGAMRSRLARFGSALGITMLVILPVLGVGLSGFIPLYQEWLQALQSKGLPIDTHNQSLLAFMLRILSDVPAPSLQLGGVVSSHGFKLLSEDTSLFVGKVVILAIFTVLITGVVKFSKKPSFDRAMVLTALIALPSHLIWKPYFIFSIPLLSLAFSRALEKRSEMKAQFISLIVLGLILSCTSYEFVGRTLAAKLDAWSIFYWIDLIAILISVRVLSKKPSSQSSY